MVNSWSLLYDEMYGPEDEAANLKEWKEKQLAQGKPMTDDATYITEYPEAYMYSESEPITNVSLNYEELNLNIHANSPYNSGYEQDFYKEELKKMTDSRNKYHEDEILKDIKDYV